MKFFDKDVPSARQGEIYFVRIANLPQNLKKIDAVNGKYIIAHSETSHHHVMEAKNNVQYFSTDDPLVSYLQIIEATEETENLLEHLRSFDTHETISFAPGNYLAITGRESAPEGWRKVID